MKKTLSLILSVLMLLSITAGMDFSAFADIPVTSVYVSGVKKPYSGDSPVYELSTNSSAYSIDTNTYTNGVYWEDNTDSVGLTTNSVFKAGHNYSVTIRIKLNDGYYVDDSQVSCSVDGTPAALVQVPGETKLYDVTLRLSNCQASEVIQSVSVSDFIFPKAGEKMSTAFTVSGGDAYSLYTVQDDPGFVTGRVKWYDTNTNTDLTANDTFTATHYYTFYIRLAAKDGYEFKTKDSYGATTEPLHDVSVYVNGSDRDPNTSQYIAQTMAFYHVDWAPSRKYLQIYGTYYCKGNITTINLKGSESFVEGQTPSYYFYSANNNCIVDPTMDDYRQIRNGVAYYDLTEDRYLLPGDTFISGHSYTKEMAVMPNYGYTLNGLGSATYNGERASIIGHFRHRDRDPDNEVICYILGTCPTPIANTAKVMMKYKTCVYDGKVHKQSIKVYNGTTLLKNNVDYTVAYSVASPKVVRNYTATITFKGKYSGTKTVTYTIIPQKTSFLKTATATRNSIRVNWKEQKKQTGGYEIEYSTQAAFKSNNNSVYITSNTTTAKTIKGLKKNKKYYFRIRTYKAIKKNGRTTRIYSNWSGVKEVKTSK